jgi:glycosyltransferase involved in cell wall biosynthesis
MVGDGVSGGLGRYEAEIESGLRAQGVLVDRCALHAPACAGVLGRVTRRLRIDVETVLRTHPFVLDVQNVDLVHFCNQDMGTGVLWLRRKRAHGDWNGPIVVTVHDVFWRRVAVDPELRAVVGKEGHWEMMLRRLGENGIRRADRIIVDSLCTKADVVRFLGIPEERVSVVYLGGSELYRLREAPLPPEVDKRWRDGYVLYVGSQQRRKNVNVLVEAIRDVRRGGADIGLVVAGASRVLDASKGARVGLFSSGAASGDEVIETGRVEDATLASLYRNAVVFALPSLWEGFGLPVLEAMGCGCPVVVSDRGALPEVVGKAGIVIKGNKPFLWSEAIVRLLHCRDERTRLVAAGRKRAAAFTWERTAQATLDVYKDVLSEWR